MSLSNADDTDGPDAPQGRRPLRLCFVCSDYPPGPHGGIGTMTQLLGRALAARGAAVRVAGVYPPGYPAEDLGEDQGVRVRRLRQPGYPLGWMMARARLARLAQRWARAGEVDLVEVPDWEGWAAGWPALPVPVVARLNGSTVYFAAERGAVPGRLARRLEGASLRRADFICSASRYTAERTQQLFHLAGGTPTVLYNPVEPAAPNSGTRERGLVVFTGTLTEKKGVVSLIRAWPLVAGAVPDAELHIYGKDGMTASHPSLREHLISLLPPAVRPTVRFHGHVPRATVLAALQRAWVAVFPSYAEAFALAPLEAMATGCPTVYSRRGSGPELIRDGVDGLLIDPDRPEEIAASLVRVLQDESLARRLAEAGPRRVAQEFSLDVLVERNLAYYRQCIAAHHRSRGRAAS